jgi:glycosyltransferase involved in cell wall biosynthesis
MQKIVILSINYEPSQFLKEPDNDNEFFKYGFGSAFAKIFGAYLNNYQIEVWRLDSYCVKKYYEIEIKNVKYRVFKSIKIYKLGHFSRKFIKELRKEVKATSPILFVEHTNSWQTYMITYLFKGEKIITTNHGDWSPFFLYQNTTGLRKLRAWMAMKAEKKTFKYINYFLICDYKQIPYIEKVVPHFKYQIYSGGLDTNNFKIISREEARKELGWDLNKKYILYVGKLYKYKQVDELILMWDSIRKERPEVELALVGNESRGSWGEEYYDMAVEYGAMVVGRVLNIELYKYYCAADLYVLLALRDDYFGGIGIAPLESLACNTPVVTYSMRNYIGEDKEKLGEIPDTMEGYREAILKVLDNRDKYKDMRESVIKYYSWEVVAKRTDEIFKEVLELNKRK